MRDYWFEAQMGRALMNTLALMGVYRLGEWLWKKVKRHPGSAPRCLR